MGKGVCNEIVWQHYEARMLLWIKTKTSDRVAYKELSRRPKLGLSLQRFHRAKENMRTSAHEQRRIANETLAAINECRDRILTYWDPLLVDKFCTERELPDKIFSLLSRSRKVLAERIEMFDHIGNLPQVLSRILDRVDGKLQAITPATINEGLILDIEMHELTNIDHELDEYENWYRRKSDKGELAEVVRNMRSLVQQALEERKQLEQGFELLNPTGKQNILVIRQARLLRVARDLRRALHDI